MRRGWLCERKNKAFIFFYVFSLVSLVLSVLYYLRFLQSDYNYELNGVLKFNIACLNPCIGFCYLSNW